jgi:hypothetical protein
MSGDSDDVLRAARGGSPPKHDMPEMGSYEAMNDSGAMDHGTPARGGGPAGEPMPDHVRDGAFAAYWRDRGPSADESSAFVAGIEFAMDWLRAAAAPPRGAPPLCDISCREPGCDHVLETSRSISVAEAERWLDWAVEQVRIAAAAYGRALTGNPVTVGDSDAGR